MAWENALDRLVLQQIHLGERGERRSAEIRELIEDLRGLGPERTETWFHIGYAQALLGLDLPSPPAGPGARWHLYGRLRAHDRRGERNWVADLVQDASALMDLLGDNRIAAQCLPLLMRTLFWSGNLSLAVTAIEYLSNVDESNTAMLVDAALTDLLARLEAREDPSEGESTASILQKCIGLSAFDRLPADVRARYYRDLAARQLQSSDFEGALANVERAEPDARRAPRTLSSIQSVGALARLRLHSVSDLEPRCDRAAAERDAALEHLHHCDEPQVDWEPAPDALFCRGILAYEQSRFLLAQQCFERCANGLRRNTRKDTDLRHRTDFFLAASILAGGEHDDAPKAMRLMDRALDHVAPDLESFYPVHEALKQLDRRLALKFLDAVDVGRGTQPDQILFIALEYLALGEAEPALVAAERVLQVALDLDQRIEAMRTTLSARNMQGNRAAARAVLFEIRELLMTRGAFEELERLLQSEEFVGQALDHLEIKCELVALYDEMDDREFEQASLQLAIARGLRARKDPESLREALGLLREAELRFPDLVREDREHIEKLLELQDENRADAVTHPAQLAQTSLGRRPRILVVGGNERQRRHHPRFEQLSQDWDLEAEWLMANYTSPQKVVRAIEDRMDRGIDLLVLLHWNRHETTEPALDLARKQHILARTVHYAGFTSLQVALEDLLGKLAGASETVG